MKAGANNFTVLVTDISGFGFTGLASGWSAEGQVGSDIINALTVTEMSGGDGFYNALITVPSGQGYVQVRNSTTGATISPVFFALDANSYDEDDIYSRLIVATSTTALPIVPSQRFVSAALSCKAADDIDEIFQVPARYRPLTGWTNISVQAYPAERLTNMLTPALTGTYSVDVLSEVDGTVEVHIGKNVTTGQVPSGVSSATIYADVQGDDTDGRRKTLIELVINLKRDFNTNNP